MGDVVLLDFGCRLHGYCSDLTRTYAYGTIPGSWFEGTYELVLTAQRIALEAARPGIPARELDATARALIEEAGHGKHFGHGLGHGVGIEVHEAPRLNRESDTILAPGMVITIEPGIYLPGQGGIRIEDLVAVTEDGCEILSSAPKELRVIGA
jgi:Xaa-Pro aminopeptidase